MKTLDEVIAELEDEGLFADALHYLQEYKNLKRTAKVVEHDASVTDTDGYKYHRSEYLCGACKKKVLGGDEYCSHCGVKLEWSER